MSSGKKPYVKGYNRGAAVFVEGNPDRLGVASQKSNRETGRTLVIEFNNDCRTIYAETALLKKFNLLNGSDQNKDVVKNKEIIAEHQPLLTEKKLFELLH